MNSLQEQRIAAIKTALLEGVRKYFPDVKNADMADDSIMDLFSLGIMQSSDAEFESFLEGLRNPSPPEEVKDDSEV